MKYGSLEWAQDLLDSTKENLENFKNAKEPLTSDDMFKNIVNYFTNLAASLEKDIADGQYVSEKEEPVKDTSVSSVASAITSNDLGRDFNVTAEDKDSDGDTDKLTIEEDED